MTILAAEEHGGLAVLLGVVDVGLCVDQCPDAQIVAAVGGEDEQRCRSNIRTLLEHCVLTLLPTGVRTF